MEKIFDLIFIGSLISIFTARLFYGLNFGKTAFLNPFVFALFLYFPGLSLLGAVVGAGAYYVFLKLYKESDLPLERIADFISIAFLIAMSIGFIGLLLFSKNSDMIMFGSQAAAYFVLFVIYLRFLLPRLLSGKFKEGSITLLFLICFSLVNLVFNALPVFDIARFLKNAENIIFAAVLVTTLGIFIKHEGLLFGAKTRKKRG